MIKEQVTEERFDFISAQNKAFIVQMTEELASLGYTYGEEIKDGVCWGKYMLIFRKANAKSGKVVARIYIRENSVALRLFLSDVTKHAEFIASAPEYIREVFVGKTGDCKHCKGEVCRFQKRFELNGTEYVKCNGEVFTFENAAVEKIPDYLGLFREFFISKPRAAAK